MPSPRLLVGREAIAGAVYSITAVVAGRRALFAEADCAQVVIDEILFAGRMGTATPLAWAVMPDHLHWMFELHVPSLAKVVGRVKSCSARRINALAGRAGVVWQAGYYDHRLRGDEDLAMQARYILANPLRRGLAAEVGAYPFAWCLYPP
jgi:REP element-mobilizing transposase RayT